MILLDTHTLIWVDQGLPKLGRDTLALIQRAWMESKVGVSAISFWEVAHLHDCGRVNLKLSPADWRTRLLEAGVDEHPIDGAIGILATELEGLHKDPADRFIAATAIHHALVLVTADEALLAWRHPLPRHDARL